MSLVDIKNNNGVFASITMPNGQVELNTAGKKVTDNIVVKANVNASIDDNIIPGNIKKDVEILNVVGTYEGSGGGGTFDYRELSNKPKINSVELNGNKSSTDLGLASASTVSTMQSELQGEIDTISNSVVGLSSSKQDKITASNKLDATLINTSSQPAADRFVTYSELAAVDAKIPSVPSNVSAFTNDAGYMTGVIIIGGSQPTSAADKKKLWVDTTAVTGGLKYWNGSAWVVVPVAYAQ